MDGVSIIDRMKSIHYGRQSINGQDINAVVKTLRSDFLTQGPLVEKFEKKLAAYCGVKYAVAVSSGTAALHAAMFAVGIGPGDEVIVPPLSFVATANCVLYLGATPVFADVVYETGLLDPQEVEKKITKKTKAIITVDYSGHPSYFRELRAIAKKHKLVLVDDASHSLGATYRGERIGAQADITTFSLQVPLTRSTSPGMRFCPRAPCIVSPSSQCTSKAIGTVRGGPVTFQSTGVQLLLHVAFGPTILTSPLLLLTQE